jgi:hypothetical protein
MHLECTAARWLLALLGSHGRSWSGETGAPASRGGVIVAGVEVKAAWDPLAKRTVTLIPH